VMVGVIGPIGSGLPQFGFPRLFAMNNCLSTQGDDCAISAQLYDSRRPARDSQIVNVL
jgi:hypothetical protein